jgi:hypothetical protein
MAVDENTRFQIASMSKFTAATAVGLFVDRGVNPCSHAGTITWFREWATQQSSVLASPRPLLRLMDGGRGPKC